MLERVSMAFGQMWSAALVKSAKSSAVILTVTVVVLFSMQASSVLPPCAGKNYEAYNKYKIYNVTRCGNKALFVRLLAERIYTAKLSTGPIRDAADFHAWLVELSEIAERSVSLEEFFRQI